MSSVFSCLAYNDIDSTIRLDDHIVFLALEDKEKRSAVHLTLNPFQVRSLAKYLALALAQIDFTNLQDEEHFGDLAIRIEHDNIADENELALAAPF